MLRLEQLMSEMEAIVATWEGRKEGERSQSESLPIVRFADAIQVCLSDIRSASEQLDKLVKSPEGAYLSDADREFVRRAIEAAPVERISRWVGPESWEDSGTEKRTARYYLSKAEGIKEMRMLTRERLQKIASDFIEDLRAKQLVPVFLLFGSNNDERVLNVAFEVARKHCKRSPAQYAVVDMLIRKPHGFIQSVTVSDGYRDEVQLLLERSGVDIVRMTETYR